MRKLFISIMRIAWIRAILLNSPLRNWLLDFPCLEVECEICSNILGVAYPWEINGPQRCAHCLEEDDIYPELF